MTNGEKLKEIFPNIIKYGNILIDDTGVLQKNILFDDTWWNAEYEESITKNDCAEQNGCISCSLDDGDDCCRKLYEESMKESTTKNCESCKYYGSHYEVCNYCYKCSLWTEEGSITKNNLAIDYISRADARSLVVKIDRKYMFGGMSGKAFQDLYKGIDEMPPVTPIKPKGHWISHRKHCEMNNLLPSGLGSYFWCSECDYGIDSKNFYRVNYNYCPNCGSDNRSEE